MPAKTLVLYHAHCADGFAAAYAAWCALGDTADYRPVTHGDPLPAIPDGTRVFILDFSYPRPVLEALAARCQLTVLDHHQTAQAELAGLDFATFDMEKSGCVLAWEHFQGTGNCLGPVPELLLYVQDRDLWRWELDFSKAVSAALTLHVREFAHWQILCDDPGTIDRLRHEGRTAIGTHRVLIDRICGVARFGVLSGGRIGVDFTTAGAVIANTPVLQSEVGHELLQRYPEQSIAACYYDRDRLTRVWSLRSRRGGPDVGALARLFQTAPGQGGGHACAAGFTEILP